MRDNVSDNKIYGSESWVARIVRGGGCKVVGGRTNCKNSRLRDILNVGEREARSLLGESRCRFI